MLPTMPPTPGNIPEAKIYRVLQLLKRLAEGWYTAPELAAFAGVNVRTIYRYLKLFGAVGFPVKVDSEYRYHTEITIQQILDKTETP